MGVARSLLACVNECKCSSSAPSSPPKPALCCAAAMQFLAPAACSVRDPKSGMDLCQFSLEDVPAAKRASHSSVVMLKIFRGTVAGRVSDA